MASYPQRYPQQNPQKRKYFVILVHFGDPSVTEKAIKSLENGRKKPDKVILIDHGGKTFSIETSLPIQIVHPQQNGGYGAGVNVGLGVLYGSNVKADDIVVVMNNDVTVQQDTLAELAKWWDESKRDALVGALVEESGSVVTGGTLNLWTGRAELIHENSSQKIDYVHGAFLSAPYKLFLAIKGWPEKYFMYWEDVLLSKNARQAGFALACAPNVKVAHNESDSSSAPKHIYYLVRNGAIFMEKETSWPFRCYWWVANRLRLLYHLAFSNAHKDVRRGLGDAVRGVTGSRL